MTTVICPKCGTENSASAVNCEKCRTILKLALEYAERNKPDKQHQPDSPAAHNYEHRNSGLLDAAAVQGWFFWISSFVVFVIVCPILFNFFIEIGWYVDSGMLPMLSAAICAAPIAFFVSNLAARHVARARSNRK